MDVQRTHLRGGFLACQDRILLSTETKGAQESGADGFLSPNMWPDLKIQLPGFFCLLVSICAPSVLGMCGTTLHFFLGGLFGNRSWFAPSKTRRLEPALPRGLLCLAGIILCLYPRCRIQRCPGQEPCWPWALLLVRASGCSPANAAVTPSAAETTLCMCAVWI